MKVKTLLRFYAFTLLCLSTSFLIFNHSCSKEGTDSFAITDDASSVTASKDIRVFEDVENPEFECDCCVTILDQEIIGLQTGEIISLTAGDGTGCENDTTNTVCTNFGAYFGPFETLEVVFGDTSCFQTLAFNDEICMPFNCPATASMDFVLDVFQLDGSPAVDAQASLTLRIECNPNPLTTECQEIANDGQNPPNPPRDNFRIIEVTYPGNCLLYTSPSPRDATLSRMPSSA